MLRVMDAPGFYAAFPWGGYAQEKGATGTRSNAILAHALYTPLSLPPYLPTPGRSFGHGGNRPSSTPRASTGAFRRGGQFSTRTNFLSWRSRDSERGKSWPCIEHKGPPSTKNMHTKDGHDSRGRNYKAETQLPTFAWASLPI